MTPARAREQTSNCTTRFNHVADWCIIGHSFLCHPVESPTMSKTAMGSLVLGLFASMMFGILPEPARSTLANAGAKAVSGHRYDTPANAPPKAKFTIGKDTTYVTGPVDKHGYIDYAAALHERLRQGVTPDNNANVVFYQDR